MVAGGERVVWLVDDNQQLASLIIQLVGKQPGISFERRFTSAEAMLEELSLGNAPDVILMDIEMGGMSGLEALRIVRQRLPETAVVIMTAFFDPKYYRRAIAGGASSFITKGVGVEEFVAALLTAVPRPVQPETPPKPVVVVSAQPNRWENFVELAKEFFTPGEFKRPLIRAARANVTKGIIGGISANPAR